MSEELIEACLTFKHELGSPIALSLVLSACTSLIGPSTYARALQREKQILARLKKLILFATSLHHIIHGHDECDQPHPALTCNLICLGAPPRW